MHLENTAPIRAWTLGHDVGVDVDQGTHHQASLEALLKVGPRDETLGPMRTRGHVAKLILKYFLGWDLRTPGD